MKTKPPKGLTITPALAAGEALAIPEQHFQVSGYRHEWTQQLVLRGMTARHIHHFMDLYKRTVSISALRTANLNKDGWHARYHELFTKLEGSSLNGFVNGYSIWSPDFGYGETRILHRETSAPELVEPAVAFAKLTGAPLNILYETMPKKDEAVGKVRSYRVNVRSFRRGGFIGSHARGHRRFHFDKIRSFSVEGKEPLTVGPETLVTLKVAKGAFYKADFTLSCEPLL
jgi:hypothetical protein